MQDVQTLPNGLLWHAPVKPKDGSGGGGLARAPWGHRMPELGHPVAPAEGRFGPFFLSSLVGACCYQAASARGAEARLVADGGRPQPEAASGSLRLGSLQGRRPRLVNYPTPQLDAKICN